jgi:hypothetical protein
MHLERTLGAAPGEIWPHSKERLISSCTESALAVNKIISFVQSSKKFMYRAFFLLSFDFSSKEQKPRAALYFLSGSKASGIKAKATALWYYLLE